MKFKNKLLSSILCGTLFISIFCLQPSFNAFAAETDAGETRATAKKIQLNKTYHDKIADSGDVDVFKFQTTAQGYFQVRISHNAGDSNPVRNGWDISVLDQDGNKLDNELYTHENWTSIILPYAKPNKSFYVQVKIGGYGAENCLYDLKVTQKSVSNWESEPNDTKAKATKIQTDKKYHGITNEDGDTDFYKLSLPAAGKLKVQLRASDTNKADSVNNGWDVFIYDKNSKELAKINQITTIDSTTLDLKKGTYYIRVQARNLWGPTDCRYELSTTYAKTPSKPTISSLKSTGKTATLKWKKVSDASGYYVYRSTSKNKGYKKVKTITNPSTTSWKDTNLKSKTYYYKVVAYKKTGGLTAVSSYSAPKSVKIKK